MDQTEHPMRYRITAGDLGSLTKVFIIIVAPLILTIMGATWRVGKVMDGYTAAIRDVNVRVDGEALRIDAILKDQYSLTMASERALRMAISNPGLTVHDPRDLTKTFRVDEAASTGGTP